jgi:hypothetical protein
MDCVSDAFAGDAGFFEPAEVHGIDAHVASAVDHGFANMQFVRRGGPLNWFDWLRAPTYLQCCPARH